MLELPPVVPGADGAVTQLAAENAELRDRLATTERYTALTLARATRLSQIVSVLGNDADLDQIVERAAVTVTELFSADIAVLMLGSDDALKVAGHWGLRVRDVPEGTFGLGHLGSLTSAGPVLVGAADELGLPSWLDRYRGRHAAWGRLMVGEESLGVLLIVRRADIGFESSDQKELQAIAYRLALAVENGLLHRRMTAQIAQLRRMHAFTVDLAGTLEVSGVAQRVADAVVSEGGVTAGAVLLEGPEPAAVSGHGEPAPDWARVPIETAAGAIGHVAVPLLPPERSDAHDRLLHLVGLAGLALEKALLYERTQEQARRDSLTGLLAHRPFHEALAELERSAQPFSLVTADIDDFKQINDLYGHPAGDETLRRVAGVLGAQVRGADTVYRTGGEEFCVLLPGVAPAHAFQVAERLRSGVAGLVMPLPVTVSVGVASFPEDATSREDLIDRADTALYASKRAGKNQTTSAGNGSVAPAPEARAGIDLRLLGARDPQTAVHSAHVASLAVATGRRLGLGDDRLPGLRTAARLHDIGKIAVPVTVLTKPGPLDAEERTIVQTHPVVGAELLTAAGHKDVARFVREHHENVDGSGYPAGLRGDQIAVESRVIRVVDSYLAMTLDRPYRAAMAHDDAVAELRRYAGTQFDPDVVDALLQSLPPR